MADEVDLQELRDGSTDLVRRDFRNANLSNLDLRERDFSSAHLEGANLAGSNLSKSILKEANTSGLNVEGATLWKVAAQSTVFFRVNLRGANLSGGDFSGSHFSGSDLTAADLRGANFRKAVFNEGNVFDECIVDDETQFDGASIFRPSARQAAFRYYQVERGHLVRKTEEPHGDEATVGLYNSNPPRFSALSGEAKFDYSNNDGRALFGDAGDVFETHWSRAGRDSIHAMVNQPSITGVAIARDVTHFDEVTAQKLGEFDFSSRSRKPHRDQILIARNHQGSFAAFKIKSVTSTSHGDSNDELTVEYRILSQTRDGASLHEAASKGDASPVEIADTIDELIVALGELERSVDEAAPHAGIGHNNPPEDTPLDREDRDAVVSLLQGIRTEIQSDRPQKDKVEDAASILAHRTKKILAWAGRKLNIAADEFAKEVGKSLGSKTITVAAWLGVTGLMGRVAEVLTTYASGLLP